MVQGTVGYVKGEDNVLGMINEYPAVHADVVLGTSGTERMRITAEGKIGMGTDSPQADLHVAGDTLVNGTVDASTFRMNGGKPFFLKWYSIPSNTWETDTGISTDDYTCIIGGFRALYGDILENDTGNIMSALIAPNNSVNRWYIYTDFRTHGQDENWRIAVFGVRKDLVDDLGGSPW